LNEFQLFTLKSSYTMQLDFCTRPNIEVGVNDSRCKIGRNALVKMIVEGEWEAARKTVEKGIEDVRLWSTAPGLGGNTNATDMLPIHQACAKLGAPLEFLKSIVNAYPDSVQMRDSTCLRTPLHFALMSHASNDIIYFLLEKCPDSTVAQDSFGRVPLHYAYSNHASMDVLKKLISTCPEAICATDRSRWTPLHVASSVSSSVEAVELMLDRYPEAITMITSKGYSALNIARKNNTSHARDLILACLIQEEQKVGKMPLFQNFIEAGRRSKQMDTFRSMSDENALV